MPAPTREQLLAWAEGYVTWWNSGDKEKWIANWKRVAPGDFRMLDPVGTPEKRGFENCAAKPFDLFQPTVKFQIVKGTLFVCANEVAWPDGETRHRGRQARRHRSVETYRFERTGLGGDPHLLRRAGRKRRGPDPREYLPGMGSSRTRSASARRRAQRPRRAKVRETTLPATGSGPTGREPIDPAGTPGGSDAQPIERGLARAPALRSDRLRGRQPLLRRAARRRPHQRHERPGHHALLPAFRDAVARWKRKR